MGLSRLAKYLVVNLHSPWHVTDSNSHFTGSFDVDVIHAASNSHDNPQIFELFQVFFVERYCIPHQRTNSLSENLNIDQAIRYSTNMAVIPIHRAVHIQFNNVANWYRRNTSEVGWNWKLPPLAVGRLLRREGVTPFITQ